jgi:anti-anti-sigma factor
MALNGAVPSPELKLDVEKTPVETTVRCTGRITSNTTELLRGTVRPLIPDAKRIVMDLTHVGFLDSSGLGAIVGLWLTSKKAHCELKLANANQRIIDLFLMSNLASIFEGHDDYLGATPD